jgi:hypothetical protein
LGTDNISGSQQGINTSRRLNAASGFTISALDIATKPILQVVFNYVFRGIGDAGSVTPPNFSVQLIKFTGVGDAFTLTGNLFSLAATPTGGGFYQFDNRAVSQITQFDISGQTAGNFGLRINVNEPNDGGGGDNQAAGFNQFTVEAIPFDFEPSLGIGLLGLGFGLNKVRKNWKAKKKTEV